ncbi:2'-deoxycytidine 5'-triphosphate deaminase domain-containing protein, partial [Klebsiella pneumoniae]
ARTPLVTAATPSFLGGISVSVDLAGFEGLIGYRAKRHTGLVDVDRPGAHKTAAFWEPLHADGSGSLILDPGQFY